jgi:predicted transcriptional regulator
MGITAWEQRLTKVQSARAKGEERRARIYQFICTYADEMDGPTPSINEIANNLDIDYKVTYYHIMKLIAVGRLRQERGKLIVVGSEWIEPEFPDLQLTGT